MPNTVLNQTLAQLDSEKVTVTTGTPAANEFARFTDSMTLAGVTATNTTAALIAVVGDSGSGGTKGLVPAPAAGDTAAGKFLKASGAWAVPTSSNGVIQVVNTQTGAVATGTTTIPIDDTIPQNTEGTEFITRAITPTSASSKLRIDVFFMGACDTANRNLTVALFQDSTADALAAVTDFNATANALRPISFSHYMTAGTTSSTTFKVRAGVETSGTVTFNGAGGARYLGGVFASGITVTEIA